MVKSIDKCVCNCSDVDKESYTEQLVRREAVSCWLENVATKHIQADIHEAKKLKVKYTCSILAGSRPAQILVLSTRYQNQKPRPLTLW